MNDQELNQLHAAASAIAAFQLSQFCFSALVQNGIMPKPDAERLLRQDAEPEANVSKVTPRPWFRRQN